MGTAPPPFAPPMPRKSKTPMILLIFGVSLCVLCVGGGGIAWYFLRGVANEGLKMVACAAAFESIQGAILDYAKEHDGKLPKAASWQDDVRQYLKTDKELEELKRTPFEYEGITKDGEWCCKIEEGQKTGICFNEELSGKKISEITNPMDTVLIFEIESPTRNAHEKYKERSRETSPKILGSHRDWFWAPVTGSVRGPDNEQFEFKTRRSRND